MKGDNIEYQAKDSVDYSSVISELEESIPEQMDKNDIPGLSIALIEGSDLVWAEGFGYTDRTKEHKITPDTLFSLQSISKTYTATGFLIAVDKGMVKLDDPLRKYYPEFRVNSRFGKDKADKITFRHLLSHWSGLCHEAPIGNNFDEKECAFEEHIRSISDTWLMYPVGQRHSYSNQGIDLAGYALQLISGKPFIEYMREELFEPLGMTNSTYDQRYVMENRIFAKGHSRGYKAPQAIIPMIPAGSVFSSAREMARFVSFHLSGGMVNGKRILDEALLKEMYRPQFPVKNQVGGYGLGIRATAPGGLDLGRTVLPCYDTIILDHGGGGYGYLTIQEWLPEYNIGVVILTNASHHNSIHQPMAHGALGKMIEVKYGSIPEDKPLKLIDKPIIELGTGKLHRLEGNYMSRGGIIPVRVKDGELHYTTGGERRKLSPHSDTKFTTSRGALVTFQLDERERPKGMQLLDNGSNNYFPIDSAPKDDPGPNKEEWKKFTGIYSFIEYGNILYLCITIRNGYFCGIDKARLREYSADTFFASDGGAVIFGHDRMTYSNMPLRKETDPYGKLLELAKTDPDNKRLRECSIQSLGNAYLAMGDEDKALDVFLLNVELYKSIAALYCRAEIYLNKGDRINSEKCYQKILEIDPTDEKALEMLDDIKRNE
jgi:CubicO group peptidase (beta-lactamase class C family)